MKMIIVKKATKTAKPLGDCSGYVDDGGLTQPRK
jgi:hypothetical protein